MHRAWAALAGVLVAASASAAEGLRCTAHDSTRAEQSIDSLTSWRRVFRAYRDFHRCDDGAVAEGFSDRIALLLVDHWNSIDDLAALTRKAPDFERFVLKHVDTLMSPDQSRTLVEHARRQCPSRAKQLCQRLTTKAEHPR
jgi:hypothetical protein